MLLVHGGLHGAWCWSKLVPLLQARGHEISAIDLPGLGNDSTPAETTTLDDYGDAVVKGARSMGGNVIVIAHSLGGMAISNGVEKAPELFAKLVYLAAILLADGERISAAGVDIDSLPDVPVSPVLPRELCEQMFYNGCEKSDIDEAMRRLRPQAMAPMTATMHVTAERWGRLPRYYIACERDQALAIGRQREMIARLPVKKAITLDSGHSPFFSIPQSLATVLDEIAAD
ncbi:MAG TPA: alpha/beta fold hydrolase [Rhodocyclaceae bacterium]|nr:alpha/beta fold hydrolase [Rhodocyclaceae bacterium]